MDGIPASTSYPPRKMLWCRRPRANSLRYRPVSRLIVPAMTSTPSVMARVPSSAFCRPPPMPVVRVVSTFHCFFLTDTATTETENQTAGVMTPARQTKQPIQNAVLAILRRSGIGGHSQSSWSALARDTGARAGLPFPPALIGAPPARPPSLEPPSHRKRGPGDLADEEAREDVHRQRDDHQDQAEFGERPYRETGRIEEGRVKVGHDRRGDGRHRRVDVAGDGAERRPAHHRDRYGLAERPAQAEHRRPDDPAADPRERDPPGGLPVGHPERHRSLARQDRHLPDQVTGRGRDDRD